MFICNDLFSKLGRAEETVLQHNEKIYISLNETGAFYGIQYIQTLLYIKKKKQVSVIITQKF